MSTIASVATIYGVVLALFIFAFTLSGFAEEQQEYERSGAAAFAAEIGNATYVGGRELAPWHKKVLVAYFHKIDSNSNLMVDESNVENQLKLWIMRDSKKHATLLAATSKERFLMIPGAGRRPKEDPHRKYQVLDLGAGEVTPIYADDLAEL